ncbi:signal recognition particle-docking protein FtsY [Thermosulfurimonas dismutans]|uniref:Signal recognition particle receptor FtsY n=1 Tax=Thermosulfurimonas dismutans TaxID=999894 RepID=A0A179D8J8_9BACT|nr:signal recognition particle-docking protein FtsY [Thermosulfurimonas dismutans]OAQ21762.1 Signal recognition particle receptor protein FtsY [Thermosulfurimonas dismutans]
MLKWFRRKKEEAPGTQPERAPEKAPLSEPVISQPQQETKKNLWQKFKDGLSKTRERLKDSLGELFEIDRLVDQAFLEELEEILITADIGIETVNRLLEPSRKKILTGEPLKVSELRRSLREEMLQMLTVPTPPFPPEASPAVIFFIGVNGVGKTTTLAKVAWHLKNRGFSVLAIAADTFRAAAIEQLETWGNRVGIEVIKQAPGADPGAVVYQGLQAAKARGTEVVLVDTAGRLHTKYNLMEELKKMVRVADKVIPGAPHENILVLDATTGQNAVNQAKLFGEAVKLHSLIITKMDGTAKGGIAVTVAHLFKLPIRFVGLGEKMEDLAPFEPKAFVDALLP